MEELGSNRSEIIVAMGPSISSANYQVSKDVAINICRSISDKNKDHIRLEDNILNNNLPSFLSLDKAPNKFLLDIKIAAYIQLLKEQLKEDRITISKLCTYKESKLFNSWRRDKGGGRQWSFILSKN